MKTLAALLIASATLAGCIAVPYDNGRPPPPRAGYDRDRDGVPNRYDRRPDNPNRN